VGEVILSAAKDLRAARREILRCAQDDSPDGQRVSKNLLVKGRGGDPGGRPEGSRRNKVMLIRSGNNYGQTFIAVL